MHESGYGFRISRRLFRCARLNRAFNADLVELSTW